MGTTIGEVNINLRMSLAQFKQDTSDGVRAASAGTKQMADEIGKNSHEATASLALIGEQIGVSIPRHIRTFITAIPGVGEALNAAFSSVAIIAVITVLVEVAEKLAKLREAAAQTAEAQEKVSESLAKTQAEGSAALDDLHARFVGLTEGPIAEMQFKLDHMHDTLKSLKLGDELQNSFADLEKANKTSFWNNDTGLQNLKTLKTDLRDIFANDPANGPALALAKIDAAIVQTQKDIALFKNSGTGAGDSLVESLQNSLPALQVLQAKVKNQIDQSAAAEKVASQEIANARVDAARDASNKIIEQRNKEVEELSALEASTAGILNKNLTAYDQEIEKVNALVEGWVAYKHAWESANNGISAVSNAQIEALKQQLDLIHQKMDAELNELLLQHQQLGKEVVGAVTTGQSPALYSGTKEAEDIYKMQQNGAAAIAEAQKVYTATRTSAQQLADEEDKLFTLYDQGRISLQQYNIAVAQAKQKYDDVSIAARQFGSDIMYTLKTGALWGSSWKQTLESLGLELAQLILKMTLLKNLQASSSAGGGGAGGFFSSLLSGLFGGGKASGGPVEPGQYYEWQEKGHEYFAPTTSGTVIPAGTGGGSPAQNFTMHVHGVSDVDSFKKSAGQIASDMFTMMATAQRRNK